MDDIATEPSSTNLPISSVPQQITDVTYESTASSQEASVQASTAEIAPTSSAGPNTPVNTVAGHAGEVTLYSSYSSTGGQSSQFPMQHATQVLPSNESTTSMATTKFTSTAVEQDLTSATVTESGKPVSSVPTKSSPVQQSSTKVTEKDTDSALYSVKGASPLPPVLSSTASPETSSFSIVSSSVEVSSSSSDAATPFHIPPQPSALPDQVSGTPPVSATPLETTGKGSVPISSSVSYEATSRDLFSTMTASKTPWAVDGSGGTQTISSTPVVPLVSSSVKPSSPADGDATSLFGSDGPPNMVLFISVPLCALGLLILLITLVIFIRRRKHSKKASPGRGYVQDLWVNSHPEIALAPHDALGDCTGSRGGGGEDLGSHSGLAVEAVKQPPAGESPRHQGEGRLGRTETHTGEPDSDAEDSHRVEEDEGIGEEEEKGCTHYKVVYDFPAELDTHLALTLGDTVHVHRKEDNGWWRGSIDERSGWFPNNYVQAAPQDKLNTERERDEKSAGRVSSFMVKKQGTRDRHSQLTEEEIQAEPIYCKIQPKSKRKQGPGCQKRAPPKQLPVVNRENTSTPIEAGKKFVAVYPYVGHFSEELSLEKGEIIVGIEHDRNGWMRGIKDSSSEEGWFPTVYVDEVKEEEEKPLLPDPDAYSKLEANSGADSKQDLIGILHRAIHNFSGETDGDLSFKAGEVIAVCQVLQTGWWLGCKDEAVGWFPASYVEMVNQPSGKRGSSCENQASTSPAVAGLNVGDTSKPEESPQEPSRLRPSRIAPPPPSPDCKAVAGSKIPKLNRPGRPAPPPPLPGEELGSPSHDISRSKDVDVKVTRTEVQIESKAEGKLDTPQRYIQPTVVHIPRDIVTLAKTQAEIPSESQRYPPPRPPAPKLGSLKAKLVAPKEHEHASQSEDEADNFFALTPQRKFDAELRQDSTEVDVPEPYTRQSTFANTQSPSTFGLPQPVNLTAHSEPYTKPSTFGKPLDTSPGNLKSNSTFGVPNSSSPTVPCSTSPTTESERKASSGIPRVTRQKKLSEESSPVAEKSGHAGQPELPLIGNAKEGIATAGQTELPRNTIEKPAYATDLPTAATDNDADSAVQHVEALSRESPKRTKLPKSKLSPPKQIAVNVEDNSPGPAGPDLSQPSKTDSREESSPKVISPTTSRIPRTEATTKIPMSQKDSPSKRVDTDRPVPESEDGQHVIDSQHHDVAPCHDNTGLIRAAGGGEPVCRDQEVDLSSNSGRADEGVQEDLRPRAASMEKPAQPVAPKPKQKSLPKVLPKPAANAKWTPSDPGSPDGGQGSDSSHVTLDQLERDAMSGPSGTDHAPSQPGNNEASGHSEKYASVSSHDSQSFPVQEEKKSRIPLGSKTVQKSPMLKGKKSQIPASPHLRKKSQDKESKPPPVPKTGDNDGEVADLKHRSESPSSARKAIPRHRAANSESSPSLRNRSSSPSTRSGIPSSVTRQRSNSPASKLPKASGIPPPHVKGTKSPKKTAAEPKPTLQNETNTPIAQTSSVEEGQVTTVSETNGEEHCPEGKPPQRPSKPPRVQKQNSQEGKSPRQAKSLLPVIHKSAESGTSATAGGKGKSGIPMMKPPRSSGPKASESGEDRSSPKQTLYQAIRGHTAKSDSELTFNEGTFVKELSDCDRPGWRVGMLADGTTGIYPANHFQSSPTAAHSEA